MRVAVVGAGPIGLEAALAARAHGHEPLVLEAAPTAGGHVRAWGHVRVFTPWDWLVSPRAQAALGDAAPRGDDLPTGDELADRLLDPLAATLAADHQLRLGHRVLEIGRKGLLKHEEIGSAARGARPFRLRVQRPDGLEELLEADAVIDATGTYGTPNRLGDGGIDALNERAFEDRITRAIPRLDREWAGRRILLTGAGHSAQTAARALAAFAADAPGTEVVWAVRSPDPTWGAVADDPLPERHALNEDAKRLAAGASDAVDVRRGRVAEALHGTGDGRVRVTLRNGAAEEVEVDRVLALNGGQPDASLYRQLQVHECYASLGPIKLAATLLAADGADCTAMPASAADALANPEPGFFLLGAKSYGRNAQFLLRTGWQQVDDVFGSLL